VAGVSSALRLDGTFLRSGREEFLGKGTPGRATEATPRGCRLGGATAATRLAYLSGSAAAAPALAHFRRGLRTRCGKATYGGRATRMARRCWRAAGRRAALMRVWRRDVFLGVKPGAALSFMARQRGRLSLAYTFAKTPRAWPARLATWQASGCAAGATAYHNIFPARTALPASFSHSATILVTLPRSAPASLHLLLP